MIPSEYLERIKISTSVIKQTDIDQLVEAFDKKIQAEWFKNNKLQQVIEIRCEKLQFEPKVKF